jgi:hypothetical protein
VQGSAADLTQNQTVTVSGQTGADGKPSKRALNSTAER